MVSPADDVRIGQAAENEVRKELIELKKALDLIEEVKKWAQKELDKGINTINYPADNIKTLNDWKANLEKASGEILNARRHQARLRSLAKKLYSDIKNIRTEKGERGMQVKAFLTKVEANTLARCNNIKFVLKEAYEKSRQAHGHLFEVYTVSSSRQDSVMGDLDGVYKSVMYAFNLILELFRIEKQVEGALKEATKL